MQLVEELCYNPEDRGFDSRWCHWNFHWHNPSGRTVTTGLTQPLSVMSARNIFWGVKAVGTQGWQPYHLHVPIVLKSGSLHLLEPSGSIQDCNGIALPFYSFWTPVLVHKYRRAITINTVNDQQKHSPVREFENSWQGIFTLRSIFRLERSASDIEPFLDTMTRLAEKPILQRICITMHQTFMVGFGSFGVRASVSCRKSFAQLLLHSSLIELKFLFCVGYSTTAPRNLRWCGSHSCQPSPTSL